MDSLLLDRTTWDLIVDADRNLAICSGPYSVAQDVACATRTFEGELIFNLGLGIPYFETILGHTPPLQLIQARITKEALTVPNVTAARTIISDSDNGNISGEIQIIDTEGQEAGIEF